MDQSGQSESDRGQEPVSHGTNHQATDADWSRFRRQMPVAERWAYFDHAAVAPLPAPAVGAIRLWVESASCNGVTEWSQWQESLSAVRQLASEWLNVSSREIALVRNTTEGIGLIAEGFPWEAGDNVVTLASEFPSNLYPWQNLASRGVETRLVPTDLEQVDLNRLESACDERTRLVSVSWVGYATGFRLDLAQVAEIAHRRGARLFVDAIQGAGVWPLDLQRVPVDFLAFDGHKWMLGPEGAGVLFIREEQLTRLRPLNVGWNSVKTAGDFSQQGVRLKDSAARYEGGTMPVPGFVGLAASWRLLQEYGVERLSSRLKQVTDQLVERLNRETPACVVSCRQSPHFSGIVSCDVPGGCSQRLREYCRERQVVVNCRGGRLRLSPHVYTNLADIDRIVEILRDFPFQRRRDSDHDNKSGCSGCS